MSVLKPLEGEALAFWHVAGDVLWRGDGRPSPITRGMAESLRELFDDEVLAAWKAGDRKTALHAAKMWRQLTDALDNHDMWLRLHAAAQRKSA